jgi:molybdenum cofactor guanylyltransferase
VNPPRPQTCSGLILAGGRGQRLGGLDKGWLTIRGEPLIARIIDQFQPQVGEILISANRHAERYRQLGFPVVTDPQSDFGGPLAGMLAGLQSMRGEWLITIPVDAPRLPPDYVKRMCQASPDAPLRVAHDGERDQPVYCLLHRDLAPVLARAIARGERAPYRWQQAQRALAVSFDNARECFANINTPEQLSRFEC